MLLVLPLAASAADGVGFYIAPYFGYSWHSFRSLEIEKSFLSATEDEMDIAEEEELDEDDLNVEGQSVGEKASYKGGGYTLGGSLGFRLASLGLGVTYSWTLVNVTGYTKRYQYYPSLERAGGRKFQDTGDIDVQRLIGEISYTLPIARFRLGFRTRLGGVFVDPGGVVIGRSVKEHRGFTADLGLSLLFEATSFLSLGIDGWFGFFSFNGSYDGTFGTSGGLGAIVSLEI